MSIDNRTECRCFYSVTTAIQSTAHSADCLSQYNARCQHISQVTERDFAEPTVNPYTQSRTQDGTVYSQARTADYLPGVLGIMLPVVNNMEQPGTYYP